MSYARQLLDTYPGTASIDAGLLASAIEALSDCAQACIADADADLTGQNVTEMVTCIRLCLDCADVCTATIAVTSRRVSYDANVMRPLLEACVVICKSCGDECERHAQMHEHCRVCGQACHAASRPAASSLATLKDAGRTAPAQSQLAAGRSAMTSLTAHR